MTQPAAPVVIVTRPEPEATETARRLAAEGYAPLVSPALVIRRLERLRPSDLESVQGLVFTSGAAVAAAADDLADAPEARAAATAYCVGEKTAAAARAAGFGRRHVGPGDAEGLLEELKRLDPASGPLLALRGREAAVPIAARLREAGFTLVERTLYGADRAGGLSGTVEAALAEGGAVAALFLSARTVEAFVALAAEARRRSALASMVAICNSGRTAAAAERSGAFRATVVATEPTLDATLQSLRATIRPQPER